RTEGDEAVVLALDDRRELPGSHDVSAHVDLLDSRPVYQRARPRGLATPPHPSTGRRALPLFGPPPPAQVLRSRSLRLRSGQAGRHVKRPPEPEAPSTSGTA